MLKAEIIKRLHENGEVWADDSYSKTDLEIFLSVAEKNVIKNKPRKDIDGTPEIYVRVNDGGVVDGIFVSPELKDSVYSVIDFCVSDEDEYISAEAEWRGVKDKIDHGKLVQLY